mmetsp:Transcript_20271/g.60551  ORF Transcript_20271/g.60551 Transcript_20271/m.60551 type:complete len:303 (-) Transcript_20271:1253-2161(-)
MRWQRSIAWRSAWGFQSLSKRMHVSAVWRLMPRPPARVERRNTKCWEPGALKASMDSSRSSWGVLPSTRQYAYARMRMKSSKMSSIRVICENTSTRWPRSFNRARSLSKSRSLPHVSTKCSPSGGRLRSSTPGKRYGWLQHFRSCISNDWSFFQAPVAGGADLSDADRSSSANNDDWRKSRRLYHQRCDSASGQRIFVSSFGGNVFSTSALTRRFMRGPSMACAAARPALAPPFPRSNAASNLPESGKTSGKRKFNNAQSSWRSFWSGVPVNNNARSQWSFRTAFEMSDASFFTMCPSSRTT